jgi:hypothetical protein
MVRIRIRADLTASKDGAAALGRRSRGRRPPGSASSPQTNRSAPGARSFGDDMAATAMIDRLIHHSEILSLKADSYRLRGKDLDARIGAKAPKSADRSPSGTSLRTARSRYDVRGEDDPYSSDDPACTAGR